jgi:hypothetical protein
LVGEHVRFQVLENAATFGKRAETLLMGLVVNLEAAPALAAGARVVGVLRSIRLSPLSIEGRVWLEPVSAKVG